MDESGSIRKSIQGSHRGALLPPESAAVEVVSREVGVSVATLERWRDQALAEPGDMTGGQRWTPASAAGGGDRHCGDG